MVHFTLSTLGSFSFSANGNELPALPTKKARAILAYLVKRRMRDVSREHLLDRFWPDFDAQRARDNLKVALWSIRRSLRIAGIDPDQAIVSDRSMVRWLAPTLYDVDEFERLGAGEEATARAALDLYRGDFLEGDLDAWVVSERERLAASYEALLGAAARSTKDTSAAEELIERNPYDEAPYATLLEALTEQGRFRSAVTVLERYRSALVEVGAEPSADFEQRFGHLHKPDGPSDSRVHLPFVGRADELRAITRYVDDALRERGSVTLVHGDAGIGKSSLLREAHAVAEAQHLRIAVVRASEREAKTLGTWCDALEISADAPSMRMILDVLDRFDVVIVDDAHHLSGESFSLLRMLVAEGMERQCFIIATRPEGAVRVRSAIHEHLVPYEMHLESLDEENVESAVRRAIGVEPASIAKLLYGRSKGHPLYLVELLAALVENGALHRDGARWRLRRSIDESLSLPAGLRAFIETRLTSRGSVPAIVASALAVESGAGTAELGAALELDEAQLLDALDDLLSLGLINEPDATVQFAFSHDVVREVAAGMLSSARRQRLHASFARILDRSERPDSNVRRARHLIASGEKMLAGKALLAASRDALNAAVLQDAEDRACDGITVLEGIARGENNDTLVAHLHRQLAIARLARGASDSAEEAAGTGVEYARRDAGDELVMALLTRATIAGYRHRYEAQAADAYEVLDRTHDFALRARAQISAAAAARASGRRSDAERFANEAAASAELAHDADATLLAGAEVILSASTWWSFQEAQRFVRLSRDVASRASLAARATHHAACTALWYAVQRADDAAVELRKAISLRERCAGGANLDRIGLPIAPFASLVAALGILLAHAGTDWNQALREAEVLVEDENLATAFKIAVFLSRDGDGDVALAKSLVSVLQPQRTVQSVLGFSECIDLTLARLAARCGDAGAPLALRRALDAAEEHAQRTPLDADRAFGLLADAAVLAKNDAVARRAFERSKYFRMKRQAAAGVAWGGGA